jgi:GNAT superfamily N-acetyltransferase
VIVFKPLSELNDSEIEVVARSICQLDPSFYMQLSKCESECVEKVCQLITTNGTDLCIGDAAFSDGDFVGYSCYFPAKERKFRSATAMKILLDNQPITEKKKIISLAMEFSKGVAPIENSGLYLNKIHSFKHNTGIGTALLDRFIERAKLDNVSCSLHVYKENQYALLFYQRNGFKIKSCEYDYIMMVRD